MHPNEQLLEGATLLRFNLISHLLPLLDLFGVAEEESGVAGEGRHALSYVEFDRRNSLTVLIDGGHYQ